jgi:hypothetical protein
MPTLGQTLDAMRLAAEGDGTKPGRFPASDLAVMHRVVADQRASGYEKRMPPIGAPAPLFTLPNQDGVDVALADLIARGPVVLSFFRGRW